MIFTNQALALFPPSLGQAIAQTQRDRDELVEEICCRIGRPPVLLTQENVYPAACRAVLPDDLDYLLERATRASVYAAADQIRQGYLQTAGGCRVGLCGCAYGQAAGQIDGIRQLSSVSVRIPHAVPGCADALVPQLMKDGVTSHSPGVLRDSRVAPGAEARGVGTHIPGLRKNTLFNRFNRGKIRGRHIPNRGCHRQSLFPAARSSIVSATWLRT